MTEQEKGDEPKYMCEMLDRIENRGYSRGKNEGISQGISKGITIGKEEQGNQHGGLV